MNLLSTFPILFLLLTMYFQAQLKRKNEEACYTRNGQKMFTHPSEEMGRRVHATEWLRLVSIYQSIHWNSDPLFKSLVLKWITFWKEFMLMTQQPTDMKKRLSVIKFSVVWKKSTK